MLPTSAKLELVRRLAREPASVEVTSFVRADAVPALADADELCARMRGKGGGRERRGALRGAGAQRAHGAAGRAGLDAAAVAVSCTEAHSRANSGMGFDDALAAACRVLRAARGGDADARVRVVVGCPFEGGRPAPRAGGGGGEAGGGGRPPPRRARSTPGTPRQVRRLVAGAGVPAERMGLHTTRAEARRATWRAIAMGVPHVDAAVRCEAAPLRPARRATSPPRTCSAPRRDGGGARGGRGGAGGGGRGLEEALGRRL